MNDNTISNTGFLPGLFGKRRKTITHILVLLFLTIIVFGLPAVLWTGAGTAEALFWLELQGLTETSHTLLTRTFFAFIAQSANLTGIWPLRLMSSGCAFTVLLCIYLGVKRLYDSHTAFLAALILITTPLFARYAVTGLPNMWFMVLVSVSVAIWLTAAGKPLALWRWFLIWLFTVLGLLSFGLTALYVFFIFIITNFVIMARKKQLFFTKRLKILTAVFAFSIVVVLGGSLLLPQQFNLVSVRYFYLSINGISAFNLSVAGFGMLEALGIWLLALAVICGWMVVCAVRRKPLHWENIRPLALWFVATLPPAVLAGYDAKGFYLSALAPLAVFAALGLNRYAGFKNAQHHARRTLKGNAITLKLLLFLWGAVISVVGIYFVFNLEAAWQRDLYLQTPQLVCLIIIGIFIIVLSIRSFWIISRAYAYWGFIIVMLLSFSFIANTVIKPARDVLYTSFYFNHNIKALYPQISDTGLTMGLADMLEKDGMLARYFMYAGFPVHFSVLTKADFTSDDVELPSLLIFEPHMLAQLQHVPYDAGYRPVYWEEVQGTLLVILEKQTALENEDMVKAGLVLAHADGSDAVWAPGFCFNGSYLLPYESGGAVRAARAEIVQYPNYNLRIFSVNTGEGLTDPYTFRWLVSAGNAAPKGSYTGLALNCQTAYINKHWPYSVSFQKWVLNNITAQLEPAFIMFTGLKPDHKRTRRILEKILAYAEIRPAPINAPYDRIVFERLDALAFLRFYLNDSPKMSFEIKANR